MACRALTTPRGRRGRDQDDRVRRRPVIRYSPLKHWFDDPYGQSFCAYISGYRDATRYVEYRTLEVHSGSQALLARAARRSAPPRNCKSATVRQVRFLRTSLALASVSPGNLTQPTRGAARGGGWLISRLPYEESPHSRGTQIPMCRASRGGAARGTRPRKGSAGNRVADGAADDAPAPVIVPQAHQPASISCCCSWDTRSRSSASWARACETQCAGRGAVERGLPRLSERVSARIHAMALAARGPHTWRAVRAHRWQGGATGWEPLTELTVRRMRRSPRRARIRR